MSGAVELTWLGEGHALLASADDLAVARELLAGFDDDLGDRYRALIDGHADASLRTCRPGHLTGSALVVDSVGTNTLLMLHAKFGRWLQPGGHADGDANLAAVALREATEETGIEGLRIWPQPLHLDIHEVESTWRGIPICTTTCGSWCEPRLTLDHRAITSLGAYAGFPLDGLADFGCDPGLVCLARTGTEALERLPQT